MMERFRGRYRIEPARLPGWDYAGCGWYFVTICSHGWECVFGEVIDGEMRLSPIGEIASQLWTEIPQHFPHVRLDQFVIMPNHVHGIIAVETRHGASLPSATAAPPNRFGPLPAGSLQTVLNHYKGSVTRWCRQNGYPDFRWQARFYDHVIRSETSLATIRQYIINNPGKWAEDKNNPNNIGRHP